MATEQEKLLKLKALLGKLKTKELKRIEEKYKDSIISIKDLIGDGEPSLLFFLQIRMFGYLLENDPDKTISELGVKIRRFIHPMIAKQSPKYLMNPQVIENRNYLLSEGVDPSQVAEDKKIILPEEPVIWIQNHGFKDDALSSVASIPRHTYLFFGSIPQFYNSIYGTSAQLGGVVLMNRKVKESKIASMYKTIELLRNGADVLICPEATWNKTPELLQLEYWPGFYKIAQETGAKIVPIVHYLRDPFERTNPIHTVIDDPIDITKYSEKEAVELVRDTMATWYYLMLEKYGKTTREELLGGKSYDETWHEFLEKLISEVDYYDFEIESSCDFRSKDNVRAESVFESVANIEHITPENASHVAYASNLVRSRKNRDFQRLH